jgi:serine/threonine protein kinase
VDVWQDALQAGGLVAVKRMPKWWIGSGPDDFRRRNPRELLEHPWHDLGVLRELGRRRFPHACRLEGIFADEQHVYAVTELATHGDLFEWGSRLPADPATRELEVAPVAAQLCVAVRQLHELGLAHRDISMENVVLSAGFQPGAPLQLKLIDFGMSALGRVQQGAGAGKRSYCAPEARLGLPIDTFLADAFSVGVTLFCLASKSYPWADTRPGASPALERAKCVGMKKHLAMMREQGEGPLPMLSQELEALLAGLLEPDPASRMCLGESCYLPRRPSSLPVREYSPELPTYHRSAFSCGWLQSASGTAPCSAWAGAAPEAPATATGGCGEHACREASASTSAGTSTTAGSLPASRGTSCRSASDGAAESSGSLS